MINIAALEGRAIKTNESATVWIILNGRKFSFSSRNGYNLYSAANPALGLDPEFRNLVIVSATDATSIPDGGSVNDQGILIANQVFNETSFRGDSELEASIDLKARSLANEFVKQIRNQAQVAASGRVFTRFEPVSDILDNQQVQVTTGLFSSNAATMSAMFTSSAQSTTSKTCSTNFENDELLTWDCFSV
jgi:hypothetical protein